MVVGCLGEIVFEVTPETVLTLDKFRWSGAARWAAHERHNYHSLTEYTGMEPDKASFTMYLSAYLGVNPIDEIVKLWKYEREGKPVSLVVGDKAYGKYRWVVTDHEMEAESFAGGNVATCPVKVNLLEYLRS